LKYSYFILLLLLIILGCSSEDRRYDSIEFIAYNWVDPKDGADWNLHCSTYALIDKEGYCNLIYKPYYPNTEIKYLKVRIDEITIKNILDTMEKIPSDIDLRPSKPILYDGPSLKIKLNKKNLSKTVHFIVDSNSMANEFLKLYHFTVSKYEFLNGLVLDTLYIEKRKLDFMEYSIKSDKILRPPPPAQTEKIKEK